MILKALTYLQKLIKKFIGIKSYKIQSFTYYIPSPSKNKNGYREKQFDRVFFDFINKGYEIISIQTQSNTSQSSSGLWIICLVRAKNKIAAQLDLNSFGPFENDSLREIELNNEESNYLNDEDLRL